MIYYNLYGNNFTLWEVHFYFFVNGNDLTTFINDSLKNRNKYLMEFENLTNNLINLKI